MSRRNKRDFFCAGIVAFSLLTAGPAVLAKDDDDDDDDNGRARLVNCDKSNASIQKAVDRVRNARPTTIVIKGTCSETVTVATDDITFAAHADGGTVNGTIVVVGGQRINVDGLRITGPGEGVSALDNASVYINNATIEGNGTSGVFAGRNALVILRNNTIRQNAVYGVEVSDGANAQIREGNTIESDAPDFNVGAVIGAFRHATLRIRDGGNVIRNNNAEPPTDPLNANTAGGFALDLEHNVSFRQDQGFAEIVGNIEIFNLTSADFRDTTIEGHIFVDGLNANFRLRNSTVNGALTIFGPVSIRSNVTFNGDIYCAGNFLDPNFTHNGDRIDCFP